MNITLFLTIGQLLAIMKEQRGDARKSSNYGSLEKELAVKVVIIPNEVMNHESKVTDSILSTFEKI